MLKAGGTVVNYSPLDAARVLEHKIADSRTDVLVTLDLAALYPQMAADARPHAAEQARGRQPRRDDARPGCRAGADEGRRAALRRCRRTTGTSRFAQLLDNDGRYQPHPIADPARGVAVLQYTGGTTGLPKGAMLTHGNLTAACAQAWATVAGILDEGNERILAVLPPFHIYALQVNMLFGIRAWPPSSSCTRASTSTP